MQRHTFHLLALATLTASVATLSAQTPAPTGINGQSQPAPIERSAPSGPYGYYGSPRHATTMATLVAGQALTTTNNTAVAHPNDGLLIRVGQKSSLTAVSLDPHHTELRLDHGLLNLNVHRASNDDLVLVDLPGGQSHPLKSGLYTFNADTNTVRVLKGEAEAFPSNAPGAKAIKVKEDHAVTFSGSKVRSVVFEPFQARADYIPYAVEPGYGRGGEGYALGYAGYGGYGPDGEGFFGSDYGYGYGYPYGYYGYPFGIGLGFGYYGGFGGGFRGGYGGGFHGGGHR